MKVFYALAILPFLGGCGIARWIEGGTSNALPPAPLVVFKASLSVTKLWDVRTGAGAGTQYLTLVPALGHDRLFVADHAGDISAYNPANGRRLWQTQLKAPVTGAVGTGSGLVLVGTSKGQLIALRALTGARAWTAQLSSTVLAPAAAAAGTVVAQTIDGKLSALSAMDGSVLWTIRRRPPSLSLYAAAAPVVRDGSVFTGFADGRVYAVHLDTGGRLWQARLGHAAGVDEIERLADVDTTPIVQDGRVYAAAYQGDLAALDETTGKVLWSVPAATDRNLGLAGDHLFLSSTADSVQALSVSGGKQLWLQTALSGRRISGPEPIGQEVVVGDHEGYVHWLSQDGGTFVARERVGDSPVRAQPVAGQVGGKPVLFVLEQNGRLTALSPAS